MLVNHKLVLGTVQFGLPYGINNTHGQTIKEEAFHILGTAKKNGINTLDTAPAYGSSMQVIADFFKTDPSFKVISKFHGKSDNEIIESLHSQLKTLHRDYIDILLFHSYNDWQENPSSIEVLQKLKQNGNVKKIGISLYTSEEFSNAIDSQLFDVIQIPFNILDNYALKGELMKLSKAKGIEVHTRSVFLQGLFFKPVKQLPDFFNPLKGALTFVNELCEKENISMNALALQYALQQSAIDKVLIGVETEEQLKVNIKSLEEKIPASVFAEIDVIKIENKNLLNPALWPKS